MGGSNTVSVALAFGAGLLTFLSPCILPLIPAYLSYITGASFDELKDKEKKDIHKKTLIHSLFFVLGFSIIFILLGASATYFGSMLTKYRMLLTRIGGVLVIAFGLYTMGVFKLVFLNKTKNLHLKERKGSKLGAFLFGVTFACAWTPCVGPILGSILVIASTKESMTGGIGLLTVYSLGIAVPFILAALLLNSFLAYFTKLKRHFQVIKFICGLLLILVGAMLLRGRFIF